MSEVQVRSSLQIVKDKLSYRSLPTVFVADMSGTKGPVPGALTVTTAGTDVDLSGLGTPGFCWLQNLDNTNYVEWGIWDPEAVLFYPVGELLPGEAYTIRLSRLLEGEYGTGLGSEGPNTNRLRLKANTAACVCRVEAFEL